MNFALSMVIHKREIPAFHSLGLVLPAFKRLAAQGPIGAAYVAVEMLFFCGVSAFSGRAKFSHIAYWLVVAAVSTIIASGRSRMRPIR